MVNMFINSMFLGHMRLQGQIISGGKIIFRLSHMRLKIKYAIIKALKRCIQIKNKLCNTHMPLESSPKQSQREIAMK
jgi:hypothetical protein